MNKNLLIVFVLLLCGCNAKNKVVPMERISTGLPAYTNNDCGGQRPAAFANNTNYGDSWRACFSPSKNSPAWLAYDMSGVSPEKRKNVIVVWYNEDTSAYDHTLITAVKDPAYNIPKDYVIEVNKEKGGAVPKDGWVKLAEVNNNTFHSRQHALNIEGYNWIRMAATASDGTGGNYDISLNMDIYNSSGGAGDSWLFIGDSITQMSMHHQAFENKNGKGTFAELINPKKPAYFPIQENAGTGYMKSSDGAANIEKWLEMFPGEFVVIAYGTNDAWSGMDPDTFYNNYEIMVKAVIKAGKTVIIPRSMPYSSTIKEIQEFGPELNKQFVKIFKKYPKVLKGPDFWKYYKENPSMLSQDGVHPSWPEGLFMFRKMWAEEAVKIAY